MRDDFAVFILTHGRPNNIPTVGVLSRGGYTGKLFFLLDNEDETADEYKRLYGAENVVIFDKQAVFEQTDTMELTGEKKAIIFARRAVFDVAAEMGLRFFLMLEDDFTAMHYRILRNGILSHVTCSSLDDLFSAMVDFLVDSNALTVCLAQGGDFIGGKHNPRYYEGLVRKAMNSFFCRTDRPIDFRGTMNEDVTTYTTLGSRGELLFTCTKANIVQKPTQSLAGGMSDVYKDTGTYMKSFYSVMSMPSAVKISQIGENHIRIHHVVSWVHCVPKILNERWKKNATDKRGQAVTSS